MRCRDGLGWTPLLDVPGEIVFFQVASGLTLSQNVDSPAAVDAVVAAALSAGARLVKAPKRAAFGGYHGHVADPNGVVWEICHNPGWSVDAEGQVRLGPTEA